MDDQLRKDLAAIVGPTQVLADADLTAPYTTDWTRRFTGPTRCVVRPADTVEVSAVVAACADAGVPLVPQGGNTGLVGGGVPRQGEVVLSLARLTDLEPVDAVSAQVTAGAGVTIAALQAHAAAAGLQYGVDLGARDSATLGGSLATNAGGIRMIRYGGTRQQVVGVEAVLADGTVISRLTGLVKDNVGYDLPGLLVGSEGTLGVITRARVRLHPQPTHRTVALLAIDDVAAALAVLLRLRAEVVGLEAVELVLDDGLRLVADHLGVDPPFTPVPPAALLVEAADRNDPTESLAAALTEVAEVRDVAVASDRAGRAALWRWREAHTEAINTLGVPHKLDVTLPLPALPAFAAAVPDVVAGAAPGARIILFGHVGDGNLHVNVVGPDPDDDRVDAAVLELVASYGGSISAEHGIGVAKAPYLALGRGPADRAAMAAVKRALDPRGILNPGVILGP